MNTGPRLPYLGTQNTEQRPFVAACIEAFVDEGDEGFDIRGDAVF